MTGSVQPSATLEAEQLHHLQQLVQHVDAVLWLTTPETGAMTYISPAFERMYGAPASQLLERPASLYDLVHPDDREPLRRARAEQGKGAWEHRYRIVRSDGVRWLRARSFPVHDHDGRVVRIAGITEDITAKVAADEALARSRLRFEALTEHSGVGMWEIDVAGYTTYINRAMCEQLEVDSPEALRGETYHQFFTPASLETMRREHAKRGSGAPSSYQVEIVGRRGGLRQVMVNGAPLLDEKGQVLGLIGTFSDVSETQRLEQALSQSQKLEAIGQLAAGVAHDFNNLLIPILGYSEMAIDSLGEGPVAEDLRAVIQAGQQAKELTTQLLAFARKQALDMRPLALGSQVRGFAPVLRRMLRENITLEFELDDEARLIRADGTQIRQVLLNLTSNAQDAMPEGGKLSIGLRTLVVGAEGAHAAPSVAPGVYLELRVTDSGQGIDAATQARIFEPFFYDQRGRRRYRSGAGHGVRLYSPTWRASSLYQQARRGHHLRDAVPGAGARRARGEHAAQRPATAWRVGHDSAGRGSGGCPAPGGPCVGRRRLRSRASRRRQRSLGAGQQPRQERWALGQRRDHAQHGRL